MGEEERGGLMTRDAEPGNENYMFRNQRVNHDA